MSDAAPRPLVIHASCVVIGEAGVLIRGRSGTGKSGLARLLIEQAGRVGVFARLVSDDRTILGITGGRIVARPHPAIAGRIEVRGLGIAEAVHEEAVRLQLVVDCGDDTTRLPAEEDSTESIGGVPLRHIRVRQGDADRVLIALGLGAVVFKDPLSGERHLS